MSGNDQAALRRLLAYDPISGQFVWLKERILPATVKVAHHPFGAR